MSSLQSHNLWVSLYLSNYSKISLYHFLLHPFFIYPVFHFMQPYFSSWRYNQLFVILLINIHMLYLVLYCLKEFLFTNFEIKTFSMTKQFELQFSNFFLSFSSNSFLYISSFTFVLFHLIFVTLSWELFFFVEFENHA